MGGIFRNMFDLNKDGKVDRFERVMEFIVTEEMLKDDSDDKDGFDEDIDY